MTCARVANDLHSRNRWPYSIELLYSSCPLHSFVVDDRFLMAATEWHTLVCLMACARLPNALRLCGFCRRDQPTELPSPNNTELKDSDHDSELGWY